ncbi:MAG: hypothetical protein KKC66_04235 [Candidatus Omnitrophica bacterium]|nr:hypothetical protein [Candidatus Omnitrophota bacterium]MBU1933089.1 hypothetical protein [Candidatus Omnitrophota bacterium]
MPVGIRLMKNQRIKNDTALFLRRSIKAEAKRIMIKIIDIKTGNSKIGLATGT